MDALARALDAVVYPSVGVAVLVVVVPVVVGATGTSVIIYMRLGDRLGFSQEREVAMTSGVRVAVQTVAVSVNVRVVDRGDH